MGDLNTSNVSTGKPKVTGAVYRAPVGSTLPTDATSALNEVFKSLGYVSDGGVSNGSSIEVENIKAWGGVVVLTTQTERGDTFKLKLIEAMNVEVLKAVYGDKNVTGTIGTGITVKVNTEQLEAYAWVFDMILKGGKLKRLVVPNATITEIGDIVYSDEEAIGYEVTLTAAVDKDGNSHYEYIAQGGTE